MSLLKKFAGKYQEQLLELNFHHLTLVFLWMKWKQIQQPFIWLRYIDNIFFILIDGEKQLKLYLEDLNDFHSNLKFIYKTCQNSVN